MRLAIKIVAACVAAVAAVVLGLNSAGVYPFGRAVLVAAVVTSAVLAAASTIVSAVADARARGQSRRRNLFEAQLTGLLWSIIDQIPDLDYRDLGVAVYRRRRGLLSHRLTRVHRVRASRRMVASRVTWRVGKGVLGSCVAQGQVVAADLSEESVRQLVGDERDWDSLDADTRMGLTYQEYQDVRGKYDVVVASPLIDDRSRAARVVGCIVLDGPAGRLDALSGDDVLTSLDTAGRGLLQLT